MNSRMKTGLAVSLAVHALLLALPMTGFIAEPGEARRWITTRLVEERPELPGEAREEAALPIPPALEEVAAETATPGIAAAAEEQPEAGVEAGAGEISTAADTPDETPAAAGDRGSIRVAAAAAFPAAVPRFSLSPVKSPGAGTAPPEKPAASEHVRQASATPVPPPEVDHLPLIRERILGARHYPATARRRGWQGRTEVRFRIGKDGRPSSLKLMASSGFRLLDEASLKAVSEGAPYPVVEGWITVPIVFRLKG